MMKCLKLGLVVRNPRHNEFLGRPVFHKYNNGSINLNNFKQVVPDKFPKTTDQLLSSGFSSLPPPHFKNETDTTFSGNVDFWILQYIGL